MATDLSFVDLLAEIPDEDAAARWVERSRWPNGTRCPRCYSAKVGRTPSGKPMSHWCSGCRRYFSVRTGTVMEASKIPLRKWLCAIHLVVTHPKGIASTQLARDIGISQKAAWYMLVRIREAWSEEGSAVLSGVVEVDETYVGGKARNMHRSKRRELADGLANKIQVVGAKQRGGRMVAEVVGNAGILSPQREFVRRHVFGGTHLYTDEARVFVRLGSQYKHRRVNHSKGQYGSGGVTTNGIESMWALLKRTYIGTHHYMSPKHLPRYLAEFVGRRNMAYLPVRDRMVGLVRRIEGKRISWAEVVG